MAEAADAVDGDDVAGAGAGMAKRVEGGDAGAEQRRRLDGVELVGHMRHRRDMGDHMRGVAAVTGHAGHFMHVLAGEGGVAPAAAAVAARAAEPADAGAGADAPAVDAFADRVDDADDLVAGNAWIADPRDQALNGQRVAAADAAGLDADAHFLGPGNGNLALLRLERSAGLRNDHRPHLGHLCVLSIEKSPAPSLGGDARFDQDVARGAMLWDRRDIAS